MSESEKVVKGGRLYRGTVGTAMTTEEVVADPCRHAASHDNTEGWVCFVMVHCTCCTAEHAEPVLHALLHYPVLANTHTHTHRPVGQVVYQWCQPVCLSCCEGPPGPGCLCQRGRQVHPEATHHQRPDLQGQGKQQQQQQ